jgi:hypothetical protein
MYAKKVDTDLPEIGQAFGFDLMVGDWIAPSGSGKAADFVFTLTRRFESERNYESGLTVTFSSPGDGIQAYDSTMGYRSELKLPRYAPEDQYSATMQLSNLHLPGSPITRDEKEDRNYFFRVRTVLDQKGKIVSALYGKVDGNILFSPIRSKTCSLIFTYYLNPAPNDRNMEFDPGRNLLENISVESKVTAP